MPDPYLWEGVPAGVPCWHIHHGVLLEWSTEPLVERAKYIRELKVPSEIEARFRLMRPVKGELPAEVVEALHALAEASQALIKAEDAYWRSAVCIDSSQLALTAASDTWREARTLYNCAFVKHADAINALHRAECPDCPWDGTTIFPEEKP